VDLANFNSSKARSIFTNLFYQTMYLEIIYKIAAESITLSE
jgi:hypothetical protein